MADKFVVRQKKPDKGHSRRLDADVIAAVYELRERFPKLSAAGIREKMISDGLIGASDVSVSTFQRFIKKNNLKGAAAPGLKDRRAFEEEFATGMYQADTLHGPYLNENGRLRRTYCIMILDDKSRLITGGRYFYQDNSLNFQKVLKDAATYGIPQKLYVDNGSPYKNVQLSLICGQLGCVLIHTPVRDGASKGKVKRNFRTFRSRFLNALDPSRIAGIDELNSLLADYIRRHNTSVHSPTGMTPYTRYMENLSHVRMPVSPQWLDAGFLHRVMHRAYLEETNPLLLNHLILTGKLRTYLADLNEQAQNRYRLIIKQMTDAEGVDEDLKRRSQWEWIKALNGIVSRAEEIIRSEMINI